jgi:hypothetical protein
MLSLKAHSSQQHRRQTLYILRELQMKDNLSRYQDYLDGNLNLGKDERCRAVYDYITVLSRGAVWKTAPNRIRAVCQEGGDIKLMYAEAAYAIATRKPALPTPHPELAAYRLAREIMKKTALTSEDLIRADELMLKAAKCPDLGTLPSLYRVGIIHRLSTMPDQADNRAGTKRTERTAFEKACERVFDLYKEQWVQTECCDEAFNHTMPRGGYYHMLQILSFMIGCPIPATHMPFPITTWGPPDIFVEFNPETSEFENPYTYISESWCLIGHDVKFSENVLPLKLAHMELDALARQKRNASALFFQVSHSNSGEPAVCKWKTGNGPWAKATYAHLLFLTYAISGHHRNTGAMKGQIKARLKDKDMDMDNYFRQIKSRLSGAIKKKLGMAEKENVFIDDKQKDIIPRLKEGLRVYGVVEKTVLNSA